MRFKCFQLCITVAEEPQDGVAVILASVPDTGWFSSPSSQDEKVSGNRSDKEN